MQMHPHEAWDLLELLGLPGRWGESAAPFVRYFSQLREAFPERDWGFLQGMSADFFADPEARADPELEGTSGGRSRSPARAPFASSPSWD